ncbi:serine/threonine-protein kinase [Candidatus Uabimicrobium amorphum]|uniref:Protein kinase n=1 Tax=Uabimicrobium amorphum TaxID=2596890 RepID=A0A5S9IIC2_UABAM|nr:serine/threonine-protein kinase [Candidatus Uabimicrobium amorphum]BBM82378.1 protein kinase [Candidatus Uabimicrobium amorphum]
MQSSLEKTNLYQLSSGKKFRQYRIERLLGRGAMGVVYKAFDEHLQRHVALKVLQTSFIGEKEHKQFVREVQAIANLNHNNIVKLFEVGTEPTHYFTMEYIEGETLAQVLENEIISQAAIARIVSKIAQGLYHAHLKGIVHGDIKPENIMIARDREPKIMDFGLAKDQRNNQMSQSGIQGTPAYLAPEQLQNAATDKRVDIYALGVTLYRALTGKLPFQEKNYVSLFYQIINETPVRVRSIDSSVSTDLELICEKCMHKSPEKRYTNARFLARDLKNFLVGRPLWAESSSNMWSFCKRMVEFRWLEILLSLSGIYLVFLAIVQFNIPVVVDKTSHNEEQSHFSRLQNKSKKASEWYRGKNKFIHHLRLLSQRMDFGDLMWKKDFEKAIENTYEQIQKLKGADLKLATGLLQVIIETQKNEYMNKKFANICALGIKVAKKRNLKNYLIKFQQFKKVYEINKELVSLRKKFKNSNGELRIQRDRILTEAIPKITNPYCCFYLACHHGDVWIREKLLLHAIHGAKNERFYSELGEFYINYHFYYEGIAVCRQCLNYNPYAPLAHYHMARGLICIGDYDSALKHLHFLEKNFFNTLREQIFLQKVRIFTIQKKYIQAQKALQKARNWAHKYGRSGFNFQQTYSIWQKIIANENFTSDLTTDEATVWYYRLGKLDKAYELVNKMKYNIPLRLAIYRGFLDRKLFEFDTAEQEWEKAYNYAVHILRSEQQRKVLVYSPIVYRYAYQFLTSRHSELCKKYEMSKSGIQLLNKVGKRLQNYYFASLYQALFSRGKGLYGHTISLCNEAKRLAPWYRHEIELVEKICLARWYRYTEKIKGFSVEQKIDIAVKIAAQMIREDDYAPAHNLLGYIYTSTDPEKARHHFEQIDENKLAIWDFLDFLYDRSFLYAKKEMYDDAIDSMEKYLKLNPGFIWAEGALRKFREKKK